MSASRVAWWRVGLVLGLMLVLAAGTVLAPASPGRPATKRFVRSYVNRKLAQARSDLASAGSKVFSRNIVGPVSVEGADVNTVVVTLELTEAGSYLVMAKLWWNVINATSTGVGGEIDCDLLAGPSFDTSRESGVTDFDYGTLSLQLTHARTEPGSIALRCRDQFGGGNPVEIHNVVLTAVRVGELVSTSGRSGDGTESPPPVRP